MTSSEPQPHNIFTTEALATIRETSELLSLFQQYYGGLKPSLQEMLASIPPEKWYAASTVRIARNLRSCGGGDIAEDDYLRDFAWGRAAYSLAIGLRRGMALRQDSRFPHLMKQVLQSARRSLMRDLRAACGRGRSLIVTSVHPVRPWISASFKGGPLDTLIVRNIDKVAASAKDRSIYISTQHSPHTILLKVVKQLRARPMIVTIYPDGPHGGERMHREIGGYRLNLGAGAAGLAWFSKADLYFVRPTWTELGPGMTMVRGPTFEAFDDFEDYKEAFCDFYVGELLHIMQRDPSNIASAIGVWRVFREAPNRERLWAGRASR